MRLNRPIQVSPSMMCADLCNFETDLRALESIGVDLLHFDLSKVDQWEVVFAHAQTLGIALHVVLNETEKGNEKLHDNGTLGVQRKLYYRELAARFAHHPGPPHTIFDRFWS